MQAGFIQIDDYDDNNCLAGTQKSEHAFASQSHIIRINIYFYLSFLSHSRGNCVGCTLYLYIKYLFSFCFFANVQQL